MPSWRKVGLGKLLLAALGIWTIVGGSGCSRGQGASMGSARVAVASTSLSADVVKIVVTVNPGTGSTFTPIVENLAQTGGSWSAYITGIPAGSGREFDVVASDASGASLYTGSARSDITAGAVASVVVALEPMGGGGSSSAPVIDYLSASATVVAPGGTVRLGVAASDADPTATLSYLWQATCGAFDHPDSTAVTWTAPATAGSCQVSITVTDNSGLSVTAYQVIAVGLTTGDAMVTVTAGPVITGVTGSIAYGATVGGDLSVTATDPGGYALAYVWSSSCPDLTFVTTGSYSSAQPHFTSPDLIAACVITVTVSDTQGGHVTGVLNVPPAPVFRLGPVITSTVQPSVDPTDPNRAEVVNPGDTVVLGAQADDPQGNPLKFSWTPTAGTLSGETDATQAPFTSVVLYHVPSPLAASMQVTVTATDTVTSEFATHVFNFKGSATANPCTGQPDGTTCNDGNKCMTGETCRGGTCTGQPVGCTALDECHTAGVCDPASGSCSNPMATDGTPCNDGNACTSSDVCASGVCLGAAVADGTACDDGNACTQTDTCVAGTCKGSNPVSCASGTCNPATGTCSGGTSPAALSATLSPGATTVNVGQAFGATLAVVNSGGTAANAVTPATVSACSVTPAPSTVGPGATVNFQYTNCLATVPGTLTLSTSASGTDASTSATVSTGTVTALITVAQAATAVAPQVSKDLPVSGPVGLAMDTSGNSYVAGAIYNGPYSFDGLQVSSGGDADIFLAKYSPAGTAQWAVNYGDGAAANPQIAVGAGVTNDGTLAAIGTFTGTFTIGASTLSSASPIDFLAGFKTADGTGKWALQFNDGSNGLLKAVAANPNDASAHGNRIAVCGLAAGTTAPTGLVGSSATVPAGNDIVIGVFTSAGTKLWAAQFGSTNNGNDDCDALAIDDNGDVYAAGSFTGQTLSFGGAASGLAGPNTSTRKYLWVAKFNGATGAAVAAAAFSGTTGQATPTGLVVDASDNVVVGGEFTANLTIGSALVGAGLGDAFVAKLSPALVPSWAVRLGGTSSDATNGVAVDSLGDVIATGLFNKTTTGAAVLAATTTSASNPFVLKLDGATGSTDFAAAYGSSGTATGDAVAVNRYGATPDQIMLAGSTTAPLTFGAPGTASPVTPVNSTDVWIATAHLQ